MPFESSYRTAFCSMVLRIRKTPRGLIPLSPRFDDPSSLVLERSGVRSSTQTTVADAKAFEQAIEVRVAPDFW